VRSLKGGLGRVLVRPKTHLARTSLFTKNMKVCKKQVSGRRRRGREIVTFLGRSMNPVYYKGNRFLRADPCFQLKGSRKRRSEGDGGVSCKEGGRNSCSWESRRFPGKCSKEKGKEFLMRESRGSPRGLLLSPREKVLRHDGRGDPYERAYLAERMPD